MRNEEQYLQEKQLECIEYKYTFSASEDFNHPLTLTDRIVCWTLEGPGTGETIEDTFGYQATVGDDVIVNKTKVGYMLTDIRHKHGRERASTQHYNFIFEFASGSIVQGSTAAHHPRRKPE